MFYRIFRLQTESVASAAFLLAVSALASRILGLFRDRLLAGTFGAGEELDIYFAAFRIPDFVYGILIMGGVSAIFLPVFSEVFHKNKKEGWQMVNNVLNVFLILLVAVSSLLAISAPWFVNLLVPGFSDANKELTIFLTRIMFLSPVLLGLSSIFSGVLQYFDRFLVFALAPILYNVGIIVGIVYFLPFFGLAGLALGVIFGALLHFVIQIPAAVSSGFSYRPIFQPASEPLTKILRLALPRIVGTGAYHINLAVITAVASTLSAGSIAIFNFSNNLQYLPVGIIGVSFAMASFPALSRTWADGNKEKFLNNFSSVFRQTLFLIIPISLLLLLLRAQIVRLVLGTGAFGWWETRLTAASLGIFSFGIFAAALVPLLARAFFSFQDTKTPTAISIVSVAVNIFLSLLFVRLLLFPNFFREFASAILKLQDIKDIAVIGLPLALSLSAIFQFIFLIIFLQKKLGDIRAREIFNSAVKMVLAGFALGVSAYVVLQAIGAFVNMQTFGGVFVQTIAAGIAGVFVYLAAAHLFRLSEIKTIWSFLPRLVRIPR